jgi:hypothetical protein
MKAIFKVLHGMRWSCHAVDLKFKKYGISYEELTPQIYQNSFYITHDH